MTYNEEQGNESPEFQQPAHYAPEHRRTVSDRSSFNGRQTEPNAQMNENYYGEDPNGESSFDASSYADVDDRRRPSNSHGAVALSSLAACSGLVALMSAGVFITRIIAPSSLPFTHAITAQTFMWISFALCLLTLILVICAKVMHKRSMGEGRKGTWGIIGLILAILLSVCALLIANLFPEGVIQPAVAESAPASSSKSMQQGIENSVGACTAGWQSLSTSSYPGLSLAQYCKSPRMAYVTFENSTMASLERGAVNSKISELLQENSDNSKAQGDWRTLNGKTWLVFGEKSNIEKLQKSWGGTIDTVA